ncbi:FAD-binding protein [Deferrisoma palaeochoriense]
MFADVVVIGAGPAGLSAAIEACRAGGTCLVLCRGRPGLDGNGLLAAGNWAVLNPAAGDTPERFRDDLVRSGAGLADPELCLALATDSAEVPGFLGALGVRFLERDGRPWFGGNPGHGVPRTLTSLSPTPGPPGRGFTEPLAEAARAAGARFLPHTTAVRIEVDQGRAVGVVLRRRDGSLGRVAAGAVVLAAGGGTRLWRRTDNAAGMAAEAWALGYGAGAMLRDLEFVQFHPTVGLWPIRAVFPTSLFADGAALRNARGERFLPGEARATRDEMGRAVEQEIREGRGVRGGVWLDLSGVPDETWATRYAGLARTLARKGFDRSRDRAVVAPAAHFLMGGLEIGPDGGTGVPGLWAAGEAAAGVHGANRLAGTGLTEAVVFGRRAGRAAAAGTVPPASGPRPGPPPAPPPDPEIRRRVREVVSAAAGLVREAGHLERGLAELEALRPPPQAAPEDRNLWTSAWLLLRACLARAESRGAHFRADAPDPNPARAQPVRFRRRT